MISEEQKIYSNILSICVKVSMVLVIILYILYLAGIPGHLIPLVKMPTYWSLPVSEYISLSGITPGWPLMAHADKSDILTLIGILFIASITLFCYGNIIFIFLKKKKMIYFIICLLQILILLLAASGILVKAE